MTFGSCISLRKHQRFYSAKIPWRCRVTLRGVSGGAGPRRRLARLGAADAPALPATRTSAGVPSASEAPCLPGPGGCGTPGPGEHPGHHATDSTSVVYTGPAASHATGVEGPGIGRTAQPLRVGRGAGGKHWLICGLCLLLMLSILLR